MRGKRLKKPVDETWEAYFRRVKPEPGAIRETVLAMHNEKRYGEVTAIIEAALVRGLSEPWMYDVLAIAMRLSGRPPEDIERALLSRIDFTAVHVPSMLYSAAYLKRFGADAEALELYQQASRLAPLRPEPYVLGMRIAREAQDWESVGWGAAGVLTFAWSGDYKKLHTEAAGAARDAQRELLKQGKRTAAEKLAGRLQDARQQDLFVQLKWNGRGDLDLLIEEPVGTVCSYKEPQTDGGGFLVHNGTGVKQDDAYEVYVCPVAFPGQYRIRVRHVFGEIVGKRATLEVIRHRGTKRETRKTLTVQLEADDAVVSVPLPTGRRRAKQTQAKPPRR